MNWKSILAGGLRGIAERLQEPIPFRPDEELAIPEDSIFRTFKLIKYSPDLLLKRKGFEILEKMSSDDQISQAVEAKKTMRLSTGWEIEEGDESEPSKLHKEFVEHVLEDFYQGSFNQGLRNIMGALNMGHSINEIILSEIESGPFKGKIGLKRLKSKNPIDWNLDTDEFLNLTKNAVVAVRAPQLGAEHPTDKFLIYSFRPKYEDVFGTSIYREVYDLWWLKQVLKRSWGVFAERYGVPVGVAKYPQRFKKKAQDNLFDLMKAIRTETNIVVPDDVEILFAEASARNNDFFERGIKLINEQITKKVLGQTLTSSQGDKGSQALGNVHMDILTMELDELGADIAEAFNEQVLRMLIDINFPNPAGVYPKLVFPPMVPEDEVPMVSKFIEAKGQSLVKATIEDEKHIRKVLGFPERDEDTPLLNEPISAGLPGQVPPQGGQPGGQGTDPDGGAPTPPVPPPSDGGDQVNGGPPAPASGDQPPKTPTQEDLAEFTGVRRRKVTKFEDKMDFPEALRTIEVVGVEDTIAELEPVLRESLERVIRDIKRTKVIPDKDFKAARSIEIRNKGDIRQVLSRGLNRVGRRGVTMARKEKTASRKVAQLADLGEFDAKGVEKLLNENSFRMTGDITEAMRTRITQSLFNAITNGASEQEAIDGIMASLETFFVAGAASTEDFTAGRLSTIVRTNVVDAMNTARKEFFLQDTEFTPAFQYSAVLDDRVRPNHATMDSRIFRASNPIWSMWTPANGFNCRCLLVPVTKFDGWDGVESTVPNVQPDKGFGKT